MNIRFTDHAKKRCAQRKISEKWLKARLITVPFSPSPNKHEMLLEKTNVFVVFYDGETTRTVITLFLSIEIQEAPKADVRKHVNNTAVKDMIHKSVGKSKRRNKRKERRWKK